ncbi:hypothetical protein QOT17_004493 [Balamuthia mandrillaris]
MGKSLRSKRMRKKRADRREKLDNWQKEQIEKLHAKLEEVIQTPTANLEIKTEPDTEEMEAAKANVPRSKVTVTMELESNIAKAKNRRRNRTAKKKATAATTQPRRPKERMDVPQ